MTFFAMTPSVVVVVAMTMKLYPFLRVGPNNFLYLEREPEF